MSSPIPQSLRAIVPLRKRPAWKALDEHCARVRTLHLRQLFAEDPQRSERFTLEALGLYFDYSKNLVTSETKRLLIELAEQSGLRQHIDAMFTDIYLRSSVLGGCDLATQAMSLRSDLRVLYTTGNLITEAMKALFVTGAKYLCKPYTELQLQDSLEGLLTA